MKTAILSVVAACTLFSLIGCNNRTEVEVLQPTRAAELKPMQQSWRGILPCADCEGIETSLFLEKDGTWVMNEACGMNRLRLPLMAHGRVQPTNWC